ncbi:hypothetical protein B0H13DRAFT_2351140 [Mycena leptocephala]|nr:hypothetical protein B0H13DRAFT_2351140 [Mycena leptocephala]
MAPSPADTTCMAPDHDHRQPAAVYIPFVALPTAPLPNSTPAVLPPLSSPALLVSDIHSKPLFVVNRSVRLVMPLALVPRPSHRKARPMIEHPLRNYCLRLVDPQLASASVSHTRAIPSLSSSRSLVDVLRKRDVHPAVISTTWMENVLARTWRWDVTSRTSYVLWYEEVKIGASWKAPRSLSVGAPATTHSYLEVTWTAAATLVELDATPLFKPQTIALGCPGSVQSSSELPCPTARIDHDNVMVLMYTDPRPHSSPSAVSVGEEDEDADETDGGQGETSIVKSVVICRVDAVAFPGTSVNREVFPGHIAYGAFVQRSLSVPSAAQYMHPISLSPIGTVAHRGADIHRVGHARGLRCIASGDEAETLSPAASEATEYHCKRRQALAARKPSIDERPRTSSWCSGRGGAPERRARTWDRKDLSMPNGPVLA